MHIPFRHSLLMSLGIVMLAITLLAFASMAASIFIADTTEGLATAINESGALRMRSYRIATNLTHDNSENSQHWNKTAQLVSEFENHLYNTNLTAVIPDNPQDTVTQAYKKIAFQWQKDIKPLFDIYLDGITNLPADSFDKLDMSISEDAVNNLRSRYFLIVPEFVNNIDHLVSLLEINTENKIKQLRSFQFIAISLTVLLIITALILTYRRIQRPLKYLLTGADRARQRDFAFRIDYTGKDEFGQLSAAFNAMAEDLSKIYNELEQRIRQKTHDLQQSNLSLELLYKTVNRLNQADSPHTAYNTILQDLQQVSSIRGGAICLNDKKLEKASMLASTLSNSDLTQQDCLVSNCKDCLHLQNNSTDNIDSDKPISIPITDLNEQYGVLIIETEKNQHLETWQQQLLDTIANHIGIAIKLSHQSAESRRISLIEERGAIARELHDSLAQSLTFMKIQLSRLQSLNNQKENNSDEADIISELREGLNSAYRELRELLTTFRLKIDGKDFNEALVKTILEFNDRTDTNIKYDNQITYYDLTPNEEIHILQLIREALSNIVQHAEAATATVRINYTPAGDIQVNVDDNGIGIETGQSKTHHYGLNIMRERAKTLDGKLDIHNNPEGGTSVILIFTPTNKTSPVHLIKANE